MDPLRQQSIYCGPLIIRSPELKAWRCALWKQCFTANRRTLSKVNVVATVPSGEWLTGHPQGSSLTFFQPYTFLNKRSLNNSPSTLLCHNRRFCELLVERSSSLQEGVIHHVTARKQPPNQPNSESPTVPVRRARETPVRRSDWAGHAGGRHKMAQQNEQTNKTKRRFCAWATIWSFC